MQVYTVHEPQRSADNLDARADALVFIKEGFSLPAALFGPFWLAAQRLWLPLAAYLAGFAAFQVFVWLLPVTPGAVAVIGVLASSALGLEASTLWRWGLERRGYRMAGTVAGTTLAECEHRFLSRWIAESATPRTDLAHQAQPWPHLPHTT